MGEEGHGRDDREERIYRWALATAERMLARMGGMAAEAEPAELLNDVWFRQAFEEARARWELAEDGVPRLHGSPAGPRSFLRRTLENRLKDWWRKYGRETEVEDEVEGDAAGALHGRIASPEDAARVAEEGRRLADCLEALLRQNGLHVWIWYVTDVQGLRAPEELARETGLSPGSIHKFAGRIRKKLLACIADGATDEPGGAP